MATRSNRPSGISSIKVPLEIDGEQVGWLVLGIVTTSTSNQPVTQHMFGIECLCGEKPSMTIVDVELGNLSTTERNMRIHLETCPVHNITQR